MNKLMFLNLLIPLIFNFSMIILMSIPSKLNKTHPTIMMIILISITLLISLNMNFLSDSWIPFILFLMMIGGLMIIFMYIASLTNNSFMSIKFKLIITNMIKMILMLIILTMFLEFNFKELYMNNIQTNNNSLLNLYLKFNNKSTIFFMLYLYFTMICIMNICFKFKAPLRQLNN